MSLSLFLAVHKDDKEQCVRSGSVPTRYASPGNDIIGLRETPEAAIERYRLNFGKDVPKESLVILQLKFSAIGLSRFTVETCGPEHCFSSRLQKKTYRDKEVDWKVWHFVGDLPLDLPASQLEATWSAVI